MLKPFFVWQDKVLKSLSPEDVICLRAEGNYTKIFLTNKRTCLVRSSITGALKKLPPEMFIRTHRTYGVSIYFIESVAKDHVIIRGQSVPVSKLYYPRIIEKLNVID
jgi:DNA-binding LytR/AlgR family response regulator